MKPLKKSDIDLIEVGTILVRTAKQDWARSKRGNRIRIEAVRRGIRGKVEMDCYNLDLDCEFLLYDHELDRYSLGGNEDEQFLNSLYQLGDR